MGYNDPCANDSAHGRAVVGINDKAHVKWVCMSCFNESLRVQGETLRKIAKEIAREEGYE